MDENSTECQIDGSFKELIRKISDYICDQIKEVYDSENFHELDQRWKLHDARTMESVAFIRYLHQGNAENFQSLLSKCLSKSKEQMFAIDEEFYENIRKWRSVNDALLRRNNVEELFENYGASIQSALKGSIFIYVKFSTLENLELFRDYYEHKRLEEDFRRMFYGGQMSYNRKLEVEINMENFRRHKVFIESLNPVHFVLNSRKRLQSFEAADTSELYDTVSMTYVFDVTQTNSCVFISTKPSHDMTAIANHIVSKLSKAHTESTPVFSLSLNEVWNIIDRVSGFVVLSCTPSKYDLYDDEMLSSFFFQLEKRIEKGITAFKVVISIDYRLIQNVVRHFIRYDISYDAKMIDYDTIPISSEDVYGVTVSLFEDICTDLSNYWSENPQKKGQKKLRGTLERNDRRKAEKIVKFFHDRSIEAIVLTILFLRNGQYSYDSDCEQINKIVSQHFGAKKPITTKSLSSSVANLLQDNIVKWDVFDSKIHFSNAFLAQCTGDFITRSGFVELFINTTQLKQLDLVDLSSILNDDSSIRSLLRRLERELQTASFEYACEIFRLNIWENKFMQDALMRESEEAVSFKNGLKNLNSVIHNKLIDIFVSNGRIFLLEYFFKKREINETSLLKYFSVGIESCSLEMCQYLIENFKEDINLNSNSMRQFVLIAVVKKSLQLLQFCKRFISTFDKSALFLAIKFGSIQIIEYLIHSGVDISSKDEEQRTILHMVSHIDDPYLFSYLLCKAQYLINEQDATGSFPLYKAAKFGFISHVALLLHDGSINLSLKTIDNECLLHAAVRSQSKSMVSYVIKRMSSGIFKEQYRLQNTLGYTPLDLAVSLADRQIVECLISRTKSIEIVTYGHALTSASSPSNFSEFFSCTPCFGLFFCLMLGFMRRVSYHFEFKSDVYSFERWFDLSREYRIYPQYQSMLNETSELCTFLLKVFESFIPDILNTKDSLGMTPLSLAVCCNAKVITRNLIEKGAEYCSVSDDKSTLLHYSLKFGSSDLIHIFSDFPDRYINALDAKGFCAVDFLIKHSKEEMEIFFEYLCNQGLQLEDENGDTIFHRLARCNVVEEFGILESLVVDNWISLSNIICHKFESAFGCINKNGDPPLWDLTVHGKRDIVRYFLSIGANIYEVCSNERTLFHAAVLSKSGPMLNIIIDHAINIIDRPDHRGTTPLMLAVSMQLNDIVAIFINNRKCNLRKTNAKGKDAFDIAFEMENIVCARKIMQAVPDINRRKPVDRLYSAISSNSENMKILLEFRYGINSRDHDGETVLHRAVRERNITAIISILKIPDKEVTSTDYESRITETFVSGDGDFVQQPFIGKSSLLNLPTSRENKSPIFITLEIGYNEGYYNLMTSKPDLNIRTYTKQTVIHAAIIGVTRNELDFNILEELLEECPDLINLPDDFNVTPLFMQESLESTKIPSLLMYHGAEFRKKSVKNENIIHLLSRYDNFQAIDCFLERNHTLAFEEDENGFTPLHLSVIQCKGNDSVLLRNLCRQNETYIRKHGIQICKLALLNRKLDTLTDIFSNVLKVCDQKDLEILVSRIISLKSGQEFEKCIQQAVENGNLTIIEEILIHGNEDCIDENGNTLMYYAVRSKSPEVLMYLFKRAPGLKSAKNLKGFSILEETLLEGNFSCLNYLIRILDTSEYEDIVHKAVVNANPMLFHEILEKLEENLSYTAFQQLINFKKNPPCLEALSRRYFDKLQSIVSFGAEIFDQDYRSKFIDSLHTAVISNDLQMVMALVDCIETSVQYIDMETDIWNKKLDNNEILLITAFKLDNSDIANLLLELNPDIYVLTDDGSTLMHAAISHCHVDLAECLCKMDLSLVNKPDYQGKTPLDHALQSKNMEIINTVSMLSKSYHFSSMYFFKIIKKAVRQNNFTENVMPFLLQKDFPLHLIQNDRKQSILHLCVLYENYRALEIILEKSTNKRKLLNIQDRRGMTVLYHFVTKGNYYYVKLCLLYGSDPNIPHYSGDAYAKKLWFTTFETELKFPLQVAVNNKDYNISKLLIDNNAETIIQGTNGENLLFLAIALRDTEICELLMEADKSLAHGFYKKVISPHMFEFLLHGDVNHVVMKRSSLSKQILLLLKISNSEIVRHITTDFTKTDIIYVLIPILITLLVLDSNFIMTLLGIICFFFVRKPCKDGIVRSIFYTILFLSLFVNFFFQNNENSSIEPRVKQFFRKYKHLTDVPMDRKPLHYDIVEFCLLGAFVYFILYHIHRFVFS